LAGFLAVTYQQERLEHRQVFDDRGKSVGIVNLPGIASSRWSRAKIGRKPS
jgi:hypothetical protein